MQRIGIAIVFTILVVDAVRSRLKAARLERENAIWLRLMTARAMQPPEPSTAIVRRRRPQELSDSDRYA